MVLSMDRWVGKVAVVTGAASGIGAAIVNQLVEKGLIVVGIDLHPEPIEERAKILSGKKGKLYAIKADIGKEEDVLRAFKWITENLGPVHILANNAGYGKFGSLMDDDTETWKTVLNTNVLGLCMASREAIKIMRANNINGHIVHTNSTLGHRALFEGREILNPEDIADGVVYALSTPEHVQVIFTIFFNDWNDTLLHAVKTNINQEGDILNAIDRISQNLASLHILVINAGYGEYDSLLDDDTKT
ncbi:adh short and/or KR domain containing protein [Asbolus verrucosus]|uniref:Adh short and/or KR domain containing protein n=1 Tax=Asbolus verrucosus TaxID=1661398 RepID=A0A482VJC5_ASBVE|nr:adh short and/or KR domain containing protein [Asbolus verrucosus]